MTHVRSWWWFGLVLAVPGLLSGATVTPAPAIAAPPAIPAAVWKDLLTHLPYLATVRRLDLAAPAVIAAIAAWQKEFDGAVVITPGDAFTSWVVNQDLVTSDDHHFNFQIDPDSNQAQLLELDPKNPHATLQSYSIPDQLMAELHFQVPKEVTLKDPLNERIDCVVNNMALQDVVQQLCGSAGIDYVTRSDIGRTLLITMHLTDKRRCDCLALAAESCGWLISPAKITGPLAMDLCTFHLNQLPEIIDAADYNTQQDERKAPLTVIHLQLQVYKSSQRERVISLLPPLAAAASK